MDFTLTVKGVFQLHIRLVRVSHCTVPLFHCHALEMVLDAPDLRIDDDVKKEMDAADEGRKTH